MFTIGGLQAAMDFLAFVNEGDPGNNLQHDNQSRFNLIDVSIVSVERGALFEGSAVLFWTNGYSRVM